MRDELQDILKESSYYALLLIVMKVLASAGLGDLQIQDRRTPKGKTRSGGFEIQASGCFAGFPVRTVVKVINDTVRLRMVDENAGAVLRTGADLGLIVSPHGATKKAMMALEHHASRVKLLEGGDLVTLMCRFRVGLLLDGSIDYAFFRTLEEEAEHFLSLILWRNHANR